MTPRAADLLDELRAGRASISADGKLTRVKHARKPRASLQRVQTHASVAHGVVGAARWIEIPITTTAPENNRLAHVQQASKRAGKQLRQTLQLLRALHGTAPTAPAWVVVLTRIAPGDPDDDNVWASFKHVRDGVAKWLGINDGNRKRIRFVVREEKSPLYGVRVEMLPIDLQPSEGLQCTDIGNVSVRWHVCDDNGRGFAIILIRSQAGISDYVQLEVPIRPTQHPMARILACIVSALLLEPPGVRP